MSPDRLPSKDIRNKRRLMRREAYRQVFAPRVRSGESLTLDQAKLLLNKFNRNNHLNEQHKVSINSLFAAAMDDNDRQGVVSMASLRLQEIDRTFHRTSDPGIKRVLEIERSALKKAVGLFSSEQK